MSAQILPTSDGILTVKVSGKLAHSDLVAVQRQVAEMLQPQQKIPILIIAEDFQGWERAGDWGDVSFQAQYDPQFTRMALVGERKWEDLALVFVSKGFRRFPIEYFPSADLSKARSWLTQRA